MLKCLNQLKTTSMLGKSVKNDELTQRTILTLSELREHLAEYVNKIHQEMETNKQEIQFFNEALTQLNLLNANKRTSNEEDCINLLISMLQRTPTVRKSESESSETEPANNEPTVERDCEYRKKFPFKQIYD